MTTGVNPLVTLYNGSVGRTIRVICPSCKKINPSQRGRCIYCEKELAGATLAAGEESQYYHPHGRRVPWLWILLILGGGGGAAYWFWYLPWQRGALVKDSRVGGAHEETLDINADGSTVTASLDGAPGTGSLVVEQDGAAISGADGALPLQARGQVKRGPCRVRASSSAGFANLRIWIRAP